MENQQNYPLLSQINSPEDLRKLPEETLENVAHELRNFILHSLHTCGGHLGANLGTVELTIALHYIFNTPDDQLIWDVGHQAYPHKILTGRRDKITSIRQYQGLAPFPQRDESIYDTFGVGHSSTSISAALGMSIAFKQLNASQKSIAVIGDGAMTAGMAFEALNHAGDIKANLLVILNDNDMSISHNVGGLSNYLARILSGKFYTSMRESGKKVLSAIPPMKELAKRTEEHMKGMIIPGTLFEELGFNYIGPIDGHDLPTLIKTLRNLQALEGPQFLHVVTQKGKGYAPAEADPVGYHAVMPGYLEKKDQSTPKAEKTYSEIFSDWVCDIATQDSKVVAITPAMREGSGLVRFSELFPERYFDVGIAEQHSVTLAAGMACQGLKPIVAIYSSFLQRAYDQLIHDVALQNLPVVFAIDRAGLVGGDGATHNGQFDLSYLRCIPNLIIMAPSDENECRQMLYTGYLHNGPSCVRYPRGTGIGAPIKQEMTAIPLGSAVMRRQGDGKIAILTFGSMMTTALIAGEELNATVINMRFVKPLDEQMILSIAKTHQYIVTLEENAVLGGAGTSVSEVLNRHSSLIPILQLGLPDQFIGHGNPKLLLKENQLDPTHVIHSIKQFCSSNINASEKSIPTF